MPDIVLMEIYRLPVGKTRAEFEKWYPKHIEDVLGTNLLQLVDADIQIGSDEYPRVVTIRTSEDKLTIVQNDPAIKKVLEDAAQWGATVFPITPLEL